MKNRKLLIVGGSLLALAAGGTGIALGTGSGDDGPQTPITGSALDNAKAAALAETGGGRVTESEVRDEEGYYEVGVTRADGSQVDVHLNRDFSVIDSSADGQGSDGNEAGDSQ
ncbi:MAG: hypothetical protein AABM29_06760 [Actinomycetota bacterium]